MHLTSLGKIENSVTALTALIQNGQKGNLLLASSIKLLSTEEKIAVVSRLALTEQQKIGLLATAGLTAEELKNVVATGALKAAQDGATLSTFSLTAALQGLKTAVLTNPLLMATAVVAGLFAVYKVVDLLTVSFEEQKEIVNNLSNEIDDLQSEYDKLKADPSVNSNKLSALKRELEIKKDILEIEKETLALKDMQENMPDISNKTGTSGGHVNPTWTPEDTAETDIRDDLQKLYQARNNMANIDSIIPVAQDMVMQGYVKQEADALKELSEHTNTLQKEYLEIADAKAKLEQYVEDGTLKGVNADLARKQIAEYQAEIDRLDPIILEAELELGTASYLEAYNKLWDTIQDAGSHPTARDGVMPLDDIDDLITKTQKLNQAFLDGETTAKEYLDSISNLISDSGLENALSNVGNWEGASTDYLEQVVSGLATQVSDSLMESTGRFMRDESNVQEYTNELESAAEAEMKLLKGLHKLEPATEDGQVNLKGLTDETLEAAKAYNELENTLDDLHEVDAMIEVNTNYADLIADYENWTEDMLDTKPIQNYVKAMSEAIAQYAQSNKDEIDTIVADLTEATGVAIEKEKLLSTNAASYLQDVCGNSIVAVHGMVVYSTGETTKVVTNASQALGGVLEALGNMIENFEYTITATPKVVIDPKIETDDNGVPHLQLGSYELNFSGKGGQSVQDFSTALKGAASYFENNDVFGEKLNNVDSYKRKGTSSNGSSNTDTTIKNPSDSGGTGSGGGSSSSAKDPHIAEVDKYKNLTDAVDEYDRKLQQLERTYDNTDSVEERIGLKKAEIKLYQEQKDAVDALNKARDKEISDLVNKLRGQGFKIDYDPSTDNLLIHNREHINDLNQSIIEQYEEMVERVDELNDANKDSADQWDELTSSIVKAGKELKDLEQEKFEDYIEGAEHILRLMENRKDAFGKESSVYTDMMNATLKRWKDLATTDYQGNIDQIRELEEQWMDFYDARIEKEKEILEMQLDDNDRVLDGVIKVIDDQIKALDDQIDGLSKANDERKKALELQKAQAELDKARNQKTRHVLRKDVGWVWESDDDAIKEGEENLSDLKYESKVDALEDEKEALEDLKEKWEEIPDIAEDEQNRLLMIEKLGADAESDILNDRIDVYEDFKDDYIDIQKQIQDKTDELEEHTSKAYLNVVKAFENMAKLAGIGLDTGVTTQTTQSSWYVNKDGKAPSQAQVGDIIYTKGGTYRITSKDENGKFKSEKINDKSTNIAENQWGKKISERVIESGEDVVDSVEDIIRVNEDLVDKTKKQILTDANLQKYIDENSKYTQDEIVALMDNEEVMDMLSDYTDDNSDATEDNTDALYRFIDALANLELEVPLEELQEDPFADLDWESMTTDEKNWIKQLQQAYKTAMEQGNEIFANGILAQLQDFKDGFGEAYIQIGKDALAAATTPFGKTSNSKIDNDDRLADLEEQLERAKASGNTSQIQKIEKAIATVKYGSGYEKDSNSNGYITQSIITAVNAAESFMTAEELKQKHDYDNGATDNGFDYNKMGEIIANRVQEAIDNPHNNDWNIITNDFGELSKEVQLDDLREIKETLENVYNKDTSNLGVTTGSNSGSSSGSNKTSGQKAMDDNKVSQSDRDKIAQAQKDYNDAKAKGDTEGMQKAHETAEAIRNKNGYSGGVDGSENIKTTSANTKSVSENTKATTYNADSTNDNTDSTDANTDSLDKNTAEHAKGYKVDVNVNVSGGSSSGSSGGSKSSGGSGGNKGGSSDDGGYKMDNDVHSPTFGVKVKKAKGGSNLAGGIYNVNEKGDEIVLDKPDEGNWIRINTGGTVIPHEAAENMWEFGANPKMFLSDVLGYDAMKMNQQIVYTGSGQGNTTNQYSFHDMHLHGIKDVDDFAKKLPNLHIIAEQYCTSNAHSTYY